MWKAHNDSIRNVIRINETETPNFLTVGEDKLIKLWNSDGELLGILR